MLFYCPLNLSDADLQKVIELTENVKYAFWKDILQSEYSKLFFFYESVSVHIYIFFFSFFHPYTTEPGFVVETCSSILLFLRSDGDASLHSSPPSVQLSSIM